MAEPEDDDLVMFASEPNLFRADLIRGAMESAGLPVFVMDRHRGAGMRRDGYGLRLFCRARDYAEARRMLAGLEAAAEMDVGEEVE